MQKGRQYPQLPYPFLDLDINVYFRSPMNGRFVVPYVRGIPISLDSGMLPVTFDFMSLLVQYQGVVTTGGHSYTISWTQRVNVTTPYVTGTIKVLDETGAGYSSAFQSDLNSNFWQLPTAILTDVAAGRTTYGGYVDTPGPQLYYLYPKPYF